VAENVTVKGESPMIETLKATSSFTITGELLRAAPVTSRAIYTDSIDMIPGIASRQGVDGSGVRVYYYMGADQFANYTALEGATYGGFANPAAPRTSMSTETVGDTELRTGGAEAVAFDPTCLVGPNAAIPHGSPSAAEVRSGTVVLFDFGAQVDGYRSDMTRTLFVGEPSERDLAIYGLVATAQAAAVAQIEATIDGELGLPSGRDLHGIARRLIEADGRFPAFGHGLGHGIGLATHEQPLLSATALDSSLPSPTVFSVEPGIYVEGETGVRIEDLILLDADTGRVERLTKFPRDVFALPD